MKKIKVLIVDDSKTIGEWLTALLSSDPDIIVVGRASDPYVARDLIKSENPDVITLDILMPRMDGITFLKNLMRLHPLPVIMISKLTEHNAGIALEALALGAIDYFEKPSDLTDSKMMDYQAKLIKSIKEASKVKVSAIKPRGKPDKIYSEVIGQSEFLKKILIVIGGSTGGIEALEYILSSLPKIFPAILITQHIRQEFSSSFAQRINSLFKLTIKEANNNEIIVPGHVYIAPGGKHLCVIKKEGNYYCNLEDSPPILGHKPSVNALFRTAALAAHQYTIGIILSGMGQDGSEGAAVIKQEGGVVIAQDESSSIVWGMPGTAVKKKVVDYVVPLNDIPNTIFRILDQISISKKN